jgi:uncharacterized protein (UPF0264 family)
MTRLLVSVRDAAEARIALAGGADLIDVKEPKRGALGAADPERIQDVLAAVQGRVPVSAALGELFIDGVQRPPISGLSFVKWGLAHAIDRPDWAGVWRRAVGELPKESTPVAVMYADWRQNRSPGPREFLTACRILDLRVLLVDTYSKSSGGLVDVWPSAGIKPFLAAARDLGMMIVLGGSLTLESLPEALALQPDYVAVRGAACRGGREGSIDENRVRLLHSALH